MKKKSSGGFINPLIADAYRVLDGEELGRDLALELADKISGAETLDLISLANKVRSKFAGSIGKCSIINAKSGKCAQNCRFCAQSGHHNTQIETYALLSADEVVAEARNVYDSGVDIFGYVTSGYGYLDADDDEFQRILATLDELHRELPELKLCVSLGILSEACARKLGEHHVWRYNMNLQTNPMRYRELIADTHTIEDKINTIKMLQKYGISICCGGIIGLGESWEDRVELAYAVRDLDSDGIPLNILLPIPGTPLEKLRVINAVDAAKTFALFRLINPGAMIKFTAGRETVMKDFQSLIMLAGASSLMTGGYLTTRGRSVAEDEQFIEQLGFFDYE